MMSIKAYFHLSHELGVYKSYGAYGQCNQHKSLKRRGHLHLLSLSLSSNAMHQDTWSLHLSNNIYKPLPYFHSGYKAFICRSFFAPGQANEILTLKAANFALTRSCSAFRGSPLAFQLASTVGIVVFAAWSLKPLLHRSRSWFLRRNDNSWQKSIIHFFTSYIQPLLLWTVITLICRILDPVILPSAASQAIKQRLLNFVRSLSTVLVFAYYLSSFVQWAQNFFMESSDSVDTKNMGFQFAGKAVYSAVWVAAVSLFMEMLGFFAQKWITAGGLGTVLLTLTGREILTNFLSSIMIHATRPFAINEWIQTMIEGDEVCGSVEHVGWWSPTIIRGENGEAVYIPNHKFTVNVVQNISQKTHWRIKIHLAISRLDVKKINNIVADMHKVLAKNPQVEQQRLHRRVFLDDIESNNQALMILVSCFVKTSRGDEYLCVKEAMLLDLLRVVSHHRARLATPIRNLQKFYAETDREDASFSKSMFTCGGTVPIRPFLLVEPLYRISSDNKTKPHSMHINEEQDSRVDSNNEVMTPTSDGSLRNNSYKQQSKVVHSAEAHLNSILTESSDLIPEPIWLPKVHVEGEGLTRVSSEGSSDPSVSLSAPVCENSNDGSPTPTAQSGTSKSPVSGLPIATPTFEENLVLGVALEGSKRVLPLDEEVIPSTPLDKQLEAYGNSNSPLSNEKDEIGSETSVASSARPSAGLLELRAAVLYSKFRW